MAGFGIEIVKTIEEKADERHPQPMLSGEGLNIPEKGGPDMARRSVSQPR